MSTTSTTTIPKRRWLRFSLRSYLLFVAFVSVLLSAWVTLPWASFQVNGNRITVTTGFPCDSVAFDGMFSLEEKERVSKWRWIEDPPVICLQKFTVRIHSPDRQPEFIVLGTPVGYRYYTISDDGEEFQQTRMPDNVAKAFDY